MLWQLVMKCGLYKSSDDKTSLRDNLPKHYCSDSFIICLLLLCFRFDDCLAIVLRSRMEIERSIMFGHDYFYW